jgi:hypothetical protein
MSNKPCHYPNCNGTLCDPKTIVKTHIRKVEALLPRKCGSNHRKVILRSVPSPWSIHWHVALGVRSDEEYSRQSAKKHSNLFSSCFTTVVTRMKAISQSALCLPTTTTMSKQSQTFFLTYQKKSLRTVVQRRLYNAVYSNFILSYHVVQLSTFYRCLSSFLLISLP